MLLFERTIRTVSRPTPGGSAKYRRNLFARTYQNLYFMPMTVQIARLIDRANLSTMSLAMKIVKNYADDGSSSYTFQSAKQRRGLYLTKDYELAQEAAIELAFATKSKPLLFVLELNEEDKTTKFIQVQKRHPKDLILTSRLDKSRIQAILGVEYKYENTDDQEVQVVKSKITTNNVAPADIEEVKSNGEMLHQTLLQKDLEAYARETADDIAPVFKAQVANKLEERLKDDPDFNDFAREHLDPYDMNRSVSLLISQWANTSADSSQLSVSMQLAAAEEFGMPEQLTYHMDSYVVGRAEQLADVRAGQRKFIRAMYEATQEQLKSEGIEELYLFRGMAWNYEPSGLDKVTWDRSLHEVEFMTQPMSSFSYSFEESMKFASDIEGMGDEEPPRYSAVVFIKVPRERVLSTFRTGYGCTDEAEVVLLGGTDTYRLFAFSEQDNPVTYKEHSLIKESLITGKSATRPRTIDDK
ncbi:hypothetical protein SP15_258 [Bacillus phage SP-15]|uniref:Uncharacterized protein n=1 Tax=Bacillus phage SP-15 TaxID=1792032 RepID=A0A127AWP2_9CAUD|nr:hypothetical protein SP15_258 [Bacillus phage SP-15]AMM45065.1 hypothetical protein SP15_258 [Bacillus phage SP-15]